MNYDNYFNDMFESLPGYKKTVLLIFKIKLIKNIEGNRIFKK